MQRYLLTILLLRQVHAFSLEGSTGSYVKFPKWNHNFENRISFAFKSARPEGLLLYTDDGAKRGNYFEVSILEGVFRVKFKIGRTESASSVYLQVANVKVCPFKTRRLFKILF